MVVKYQTPLGLYHPGSFSMLPRSLSYTLNPEKIVCLQRHYGMICNSFLTSYREILLLSHKRFQIIGITGGIGSGKTKVCRYFAKLCRLPVIDLDDICRKLLLPGAEGWQALKKQIDSCFFLPTGELDRKVFREALFVNDELRILVDGLLHPLAQKEMAKQVASSSGVVLVEIPLLFEAGWQDAVDIIIVVDAEKKIRVQRIVQRDMVTEEQAILAISIQYPLSKKASLAHYVVENSESWDETCDQIFHLAETLGCKE
jgi:dephospho-CoA kinase